MAPEPHAGPSAAVAAAADSRLRVEVADQYGTVAEVISLDVLRSLSPRRRNQLADLADGLVQDLASILGGGEDHARQAALAELARLRADEAAYARVAEHKGLLPL
jgi:hypothetical protein